MKDFQKRVIDEKKDLDGRIEALAGFIGSDSFARLLQTEKYLLRLQLKHMENYSDVLGRRIEGFRV